MKKSLLFASVILLAVSSCSPKETALTENNVRYQVWAGEKIQAALPQEAKIAICAFNDTYQTIDSLYSPATFSECTSKIITYGGKHGYVLKDNASECRTIGDSDDLTYYNGDGEPVVHFIQRYLPSTDITMQTLVLFEKGQFKNALTRSVSGKMASLIETEDFTDYQPMLGEDVVDKYEK